MTKNPPFFQKRQQPKHVNTDTTSEVIASSAPGPSGRLHSRANEMIYQLSRVTEQSPVSIVITNKAGEIEHVNRKFCQASGYAKEELLGQNPRLLKSGEMSPEIYEELWTTLLAGKSWTGEFHNQRKNGEFYWESAAISPVFNDAGEITHFMAILEDITARKEAERKLTEALDFNRTVISGLPVGILVFQASGQCVMANDAAAELINAKAPQLLKQNFRQLESWQASGFLDTAEKALATRSPQQGEYHLISTFGADVWLMCRFCCFTRHGEQHLLLAMTDITARKRTEKVLRMFQFATDNAPEAVFWFDRQAKTYYVNDRACEALGYSRDELMDMSIYDIAPDFPKEKWDESWKQFQNNQRFVLRMESRHRRKDGGFFPVEVTVKHFSMAGMDLRISFVRDITDRRQAEQINRQQALLLDQASDAIWGLDQNECINYWNKGAERIYGWSANEAVGQNPIQLLSQGLMTPQLRECIQAINDWGTWSGELEEVTKEGKSVTVYARCNSIKDEQGKVTSILIISTDITEQKKLEAQLLRLQRMESLGTLAGGVAHDLNNILTPLLISVALLREKYTDDEGERLLSALEASAERGVKLVKQVLAFGRGVEGARIPIQLNSLVREIKYIVEETFPKSIKFEANCAETTWNVKGDATQLHQVLLNLCVNARDAMPNGGILSIHFQNVKIAKFDTQPHLEAKPGLYVAIEVSDTGKGMPKHILDRIFEPFFTTKDINKGTGLGLSTCMGIIKSHGGFIKCQSEPDNGSVFKVYLPACKAQQAVDDACQQRSSPPTGNNELVLVVDDEKTIREVAQKTLERFGYRVVTATNGAEAVAIYRERQNEIAVVITDVAMPVMDGHTTITALKAINPEINIIVSSGLNITDSLEKKTNTDEKLNFLPKPYSGEALLNILHSVLTSRFSGGMAQIPVIQI